MQRKKLIPIALLASLLIGVASAYVYSWVYTAVSTTSDPLTITIDDNLSISWPGQTDEVILKIANAAPVTYGVIITVPLSGPATSAYDGRSGTLTEYDTGAGKFNIAQGNGYFWIKVTANADAAPGDIQVAFQVERVAQFT